MTGALLMIQPVSGALVPLALATEPPGPPKAHEVAIESAPWAAPFSPAELASALRLRLPRAEVAIVDRQEPSERSGRTIRVRWLTEPAGLRVERGRGDAVELPLGDVAPPGAAAETGARRAALFIALFADQGAPPEGASPPRVDAAREQPPSAARPAGTGLERVAAQPAAAGPERERVARWASSANLGLALALSDGGVSPAAALTVRARRHVSDGAALEVGAKLTGEYTARVGTQSVALADRAFFAGVTYEAWLSSRLALDLGAALQYTHPVVGIAGAGPVSQLDTPASMRLAVRASAGLSWTAVDHLTLGVAAATAFSFREREWTDGAGRDVLGLGTVTLDLTVGAGVRW